MAQARVVTTPSGDCYIEYRPDTRCTLISRNVDEVQPPKIITSWLSPSGVKFDTVHEGKTLISVDVQDQG